MIQTLSMNISGGYESEGLGRVRASAHVQGVVVVLSEKACFLILHTRSH